MGNGAKLRLSWVMPPAMAWRERSYNSADLGKRFRNASSIDDGVVTAMRLILGGRAADQSLEVQLAESRWQATPRPAAERGRVRVSVRGPRGVVVAQRENLRSVRGDRHGVFKMG